MLMKTNFSILSLKVIWSNQQLRYGIKWKIYQIMRSKDILTLIKFVPNLFILQERKHFKYFQPLIWCRKCTKERMQMHKIGIARSCSLAFRQCCFPYVFKSLLLNFIVWHVKPFTFYVNTNVKSISIVWRYSIYLIILMD